MPSPRELLGANILISAPKPTQREVRSGSIAAKPVKPEASLSAVIRSRRHFCSGVNDVRGKATRHRNKRAYSITSSARASNLSGISRPRVLAVLRLITSSNRVGCITGNLRA